MKRLLACFLLAIATLSAHAKPVSDNACLASVIFHEAQTEGLEGQRAVYDVVQNRMLVTRSSCYKVVTARGQFSWWPQKSFKKYDTDMRILLTRVREAPKMLVKGEQYFFQKQLRPKWARKMKCKTVGNHKFCHK